MKDVRRSAEHLFAVLVLLLSSGAFAPLWTDPTAHDQAIAGDASLEAVWIAIYLVAAVLLLPHLKRLWSLTRANLAFALLLMLCVVSATRSANPLVTLRKSAAILGTTLLGALLAMRFPVREQIRLVAAALGIAAIASLVAGLYFTGSFPATEIAGTAWNGVFSHKNLLGRTMALGCLAFWFTGARHVPRGLVSCAGFGLCLGLLLASESKTALLVLPATMLVTALAPLARCEWRRTTGALLLGLTTFAPIAYGAASRGNELATILHRDVTLTGRSRIWEFAALSLAKRLWLGYGYGAFWWVADESRQAMGLIGYKTPHAHNGFLDLGLQLGGAGIVLFVCGWALSVYRAVRYLRRERTWPATWPMAFLVFLVLYSFTENSLLGPNSLLWILYSAACVSVTAGADGAYI